VPVADVGTVAVIVEFVVAVPIVSCFVIGPPNSWTRSGRTWKASFVVAIWLDAFDPANRYVAFATGTEPFPERKKRLDVEAVNVNPAGSDG
jgi:hypothetical protein